MERSMERHSSYPLRGPVLGRRIDYMIHKAALRTGLHDEDLGQDGEILSELIASGTFILPSESGMAREFIQSSGETSGKMQSISATASIKRS
jgi:hypothetical protein